MTCCQVLEMSRKILDLDPNNYRKHMIHGEGRDWAETNCYVDVWIELLHGMGHEPIAALPYTFAIDFEGDQWTFFKYPLADLDRLYGLDIQELNIWRDLLECVEEQLEQGRHTLVELDSFFLPDTLGTAYKIEHVKSTVAINSIDRENRRMEYFHNQGYHRLEGEDFEQLFLSADTLDDRILPPYVEFVKKRNRPLLSENDLVLESLSCFKYQLKNLPVNNPFLSFKERFAHDFSDLAVVDIDFFHKYSFATLRQYGVCFELCKTYLEWIKQNGAGSGDFDMPITAYSEISTSSKVFQFQLARSIARKKPLDLSPLDSMAEHWQRAVDFLTDAYLK